MISLPQKSFTIACVIDHHPRFYTELVLWAICVSRYLPETHFKTIVYAIDFLPDDLAEWLHTLGFETRVAGVVLPGSPHCNKIAPFLDAHSTDYAVVCDLDLFFVADPSPLFRSNNVRAARINRCNPPAHVFKQLIQISEIGQQYRPGVSLFDDAEGQRETHINNISAGIVAIPRALQSNLAEKWRYWASWLIKNRELMGQWSVHVDQVGFCLAMEQLALDVEFLPPQVNCVIEMAAKVSTVYAFHLTSGHIPKYPEKFRADRTLRLEEFPSALMESLARLNACIKKATSVIQRLPSTCQHMETFLNPSWRR